MRALMHPHRFFRPVVGAQSGLEYITFLPPPLLLPFPIIIKSNIELSLLALCPPFFRGQILKSRQHLRLCRRVLLFVFFPAFLIYLFIPSLPLLFYHFLNTYLSHSQFCLPALLFFFVLTSLRYSIP